MLRRITLSVALVVLSAGNAHCQQNAKTIDETRSADVDTYTNECRTIGMVLQARERHREPSDTFDPNDDFTVAGQECSQLKSALASSDTAKVQAVTAQLRPIFARLGMPPTTPQEQLEALEKSVSGASGLDLEYKLADLAKRAYAAGDLKKAADYANHLLKMAPQYPKDWNYGNAIFYSNFVLGRIAMQKGDASQAGKYLLASAATPGSPQLDSFGPNMSLANELLEKGWKDVVLQYMENCKKFWTDDHGKLDKWIAAVRAGKNPDFGANLDY